MPNFIAETLELPPFPFACGEVKFEWLARGGSEDMIFTRFKGREFFVTLKPHKNGVLVKGDKLTRPSDVAILQGALVALRDAYAGGVSVSAIALRREKNEKKAEFVLSEAEFLAKLAANEGKKIFIEIGFGSGRHLLFRARENPDTLVVGIEIYKPSIMQVANLAALENLENVALLNADARLVLSLVASNSVDKVFLHFPVPWGDSPKRRVVSEYFAAEVERVLKIGGKFELRSDDRDYADYSISTFLNLKTSRIEVFKNRFLEVSSKYEDRWVRQNKDIYDMIFTCEKTSEEREVKGEFKFEPLDIASLKTKFENKTIKGEDFFAHTERFYELENGGALLKVSFGSFYGPEQYYIAVDADGAARYLVKEPLATISNLKAHEALKGML